jgi:membrane protein
VGSDFPEPRHDAAPNARRGRLRFAWQILKDAAADWSEDKATKLAAALAYYTVFSLAPLLIIVIAIAGFVFGEEAVRGQVVEQMRGLVGEEGGRAIEMMVENAGRNDGAGIVATAISVVLLLLGATGVFGELQDSLNTIWEVRPKRAGIWASVRNRVGSFGLVVAIAFLLLISLLVSTALSAVIAAIGDLMPASAVLWRAVELALSIGVTTVLFALIYKLLPDVTIAWRDVWYGAAITAVLFTIGKFAIGLYLGRSSVGSVFGAAGSLVILLVWIYYSAQIVFFGAEVTQVYARTRGSTIRPAPNAEPLSAEERTRQGRPPETPRPQRWRPSAAT